MIHRGSFLFGFIVGALVIGSVLILFMIVNSIVIGSYFG